MPQLAKTLDGASLAKQIRFSLKQRLAQSLAEGSGEAPVLAAILVGDHPASRTYVKMKLRACEEVGLESRCLELPLETTTKELTGLIAELNADGRVSGILLQHPVPPHIDERAAFDAIAEAKDVDGVTALGFAKISLGIPAFPACTPAGILRLLDHYQLALEGRHAVVVGRSPILGRPMAMLLLGRNATVTICHSRTKDLPAHLSSADIVIAACGRPDFIQGKWLKPGVILVDAGYNVGNRGDVDYETCVTKASYITPVPGGVGPMTIAMLLAHSLQAFYGE